MISGKEQQPAVMHVISSLNIGGAEMMLYRLLQRSNTSPSIVVSLTKGGELTAQIRKLNIEVIEIERTSLIQSLFLLQKIVKKFQPKVIQSWLYRADLLSLIISGKQKIPVIWNIRQTEVGRVKNQFHIWFIQRLNAKLSKMPHLIVYCANAAKLSHESIGYHSNHAVVIPNGVDTEKYDFNEQLRKQYREKWNIDPDEIVIGMIGRFDPLKNHARFCRIFRKVQEHFSEKSLKAMLVGRGINQENTELTKIINETGLTEKVILVEEASDTLPIYCALDVHVLSSDNEGWPNVLAEAMSVGLPCVSTNVGDVSDMSYDKSAVIKKDQVSLFAQKVIEYIRLSINDGNLLGDANRKYITENFSLESSVALYDDLYSRFE